MWASIVFLGSPPNWSLGPEIPSISFLPFLWGSQIFISEHFYFAFIKVMAFKLISKKVFLGLSGPDFQDSAERLAVWALLMPFY